MLTIRFTPESEQNPALATAAVSYRRLWERDGARIVARLERLTGPRFAETEIDATVREAPSASHPLRLRASYDHETKAGTLVHELCHRLLSGNRARLGLRPYRRDQELDNHKLINLFLYDAWCDLYGEAFARRQVEVESRRRPLYAKAWAWALELDRARRAAMLRERLGRPPAPEGSSAHQ